MKKEHFQFANMKKKLVGGAYLKRGNNIKIKTLKNWVKFKG